jgi:hypothetical protein
MKAHGIERSFSWPKTFGLNKILSHFVSLMTKIFRFTQISQILSQMSWQMSLVHIPSTNFAHIPLILVIMTF